MNYWKNYPLKKYWYLGFLGLVGIYELPEVLEYFKGNASVWALTNLLWLLWFDYFLPRKNTER